MLTPPSPPNEAGRLAALKTLKILDTPPEQRFDRITALARNLFQVPIALVSLVDHDRQWFKSRAGLDATETPRSVSFCGHAILTEELFVIEDATADERFRDNPLVTGPPFVRFYAGVPLNAGGFRVGTLCLIDQQPRRFGDRDRGLLKGLAGWVETELTILNELQTMAIRLESQARLEAVLEGIAEGVITSDPAGDIQTANSAAARILGYAPEELLGRNLREFLPDRDRAAHVEYMRRLNQRPDPLLRSGMETTGLRRDGTEFPVELSFSRLNFDGRRLYSGILRDISERKAVERMKSEFVGTVSHELRTPLTAIIGALGVLESDLAGAIPEQARGFVAIAIRNSERLASLVDDILDLEKLQSDRMPFELEAVAVASLLAQVAELNDGYARRHGVRLEREELAGVPAVRVDRQRMLQVLTNLISNAIKHSPQGEAVRLSAAREGGRVRIRVEDRGPGIPEAFRARIFQRFAQADSSDTRKLGGTGLGLHIAKELVERMSGEIGFESGIGTGTVFWVRVAATDAA